MSKKKKRTSTQNPMVRSFLSFTLALLAIAAILFTGRYAMRFCMGLFLVGDEYVAVMPGADSPVVDRPTAPPEGFGGDEDMLAGPPVETGRARITVTGDIMMHIPVINSGKSGGGYNYDAIFSYLSGYVANSDYAVANLETTLGTGIREYSGYPKFNCPDEIVDSAKSAGFDMLLTANNHCNDTGTEGLTRTLGVISEHGLDTLGTTADASDKKYLVREIGGIRIGMINYSYAEIGEDRSRPAMNGLPTDEKAAGLINAFDYRKLDLFYNEMANHIAAMRAEGAEKIILFIHWGDEYSTSVNDTQAAMAQKLCDLGIDIIAGSHPHVIEPMVLLASSVDPGHKTVCIYSMGNFLSNQRMSNMDLPTSHCEDGVLVTFTVVKYSDGSVYLEDVGIVPTWVLINGSGSGRSYRILPLDTGIPDWKTAYDLTAAQFGEAEKSRDRTLELLGSGLEQIRVYLAEAKAAREVEIRNIWGVG